MKPYAIRKPFSKHSGKAFSQRVGYGGGGPGNLSLVRQWQESAGDKKGGTLLTRQNMANVQWAVQGRRRGMSSILASVQKQLQTRAGSHSLQQRTK